MFGRIARLIEKYRVTSTLLFMSVTGVLGFLASLLVRPLEREDLLAAITSFFSYLGDSVSLSRWTFAVLLAVALVGTMFIGFPAVAWFRRLREDRTPPLPHLSYTQDTIDGVVWRWWWPRSVSAPTTSPPTVRNATTRLRSGAQSVMSIVSSSVVRDALLHGPQDLLLRRVI